VAFGRLSKSHGGAPRGERAALSALPHPLDAANGLVRLSALRLPLVFGGSKFVTFFAKLGRNKMRRENDFLCVIAGLDPAIHAAERLFLSTQ